MKYEYGDRIGTTAKLRIGTSAVIFDDNMEKVLLTRRTDNNRWCLPGGGMDPGETLGECCIREVREETGLSVRLVRLSGIYTNPGVVSIYADGNRWQSVVANFVAEVSAGTPKLSDETTAVGFFTHEQIRNMDLIDPHYERIADAFADLPNATFQ